MRTKSIKTISIKSYQKINSNIKYIYKKNSPTIVKRYVDVLNKTKLFASYQVNDDKLSKSEEKEVLRYLNKNISKFDVVIVSDYGHGLLAEIASLISKRSKFIFKYSNQLI